MNPINIAWFLFGFVLCQLFYAIMDRLSGKNTLDELNEASLGDDSGQPGNHLKGD